MAQHSGFFNALLKDGQYDKKYNAEDYSQNLAAIISNGVRRSGDDDLRVKVAGGMALTVNAGRAWIEGKWYWNDSLFTGFVVPTAPSGDRGRVDRVVLRLDKNIESRMIELVYLTGTAAISPTAPALTRTESIYEIAIADIAVRPNVTQITSSDVYDRRADTEVCGWVTSPVGYNDYFTSLDESFNEWFSDVKDTLASVTLFKEYHWRTQTTEQTKIVIFDIPQYDPTGVDILKVYVNGILEIKDVDYTLSGSTITFQNEKIAGTDIDVFVYKSIDGTGLGSVSDEITELQNELATVKNIGDYIYICNGVDDNVKLSELAQQFIANDSENSGTQTIISVYGKFKASAPYAGLGTTSQRYQWMAFGMSAYHTPKIVFDFSGCSKIELTCQSGKHYIGFYGQDVYIRNANVAAFCRYTDSSFEMFSSTRGELEAENCTFTISGYSNCLIAENGRFVNCNGDVTNSRGDSFCFSVNNSALLRVLGGEYYAWTGQSTNNAAVVYASGSVPSSVILLDGMNCPSATKSLHYQKNAVHCSSGLGNILNTITLLPIAKYQDQTVSGTIAASKSYSG